MSLSVKHLGDLETTNTTTQLHPCSKAAFNKCEKTFQNHVKAVSAYNPAGDKADLDKQNLWCEVLSVSLRLTITFSDFVTLHNIISTSFHSFYTIKPIAVIFFHGKFICDLEINCPIRLSIPLHWDYVFINSSLGKLIVRYLWLKRELRPYRNSISSRRGQSRALFLI